MQWIQFTYLFYPKSNTVNDIAAIFFFILLYTIRKPDKTKKKETPITAKCPIPQWYKNIATNDKARNPCNASFFFVRIVMSVILSIDS